MKLNEKKINKTSKVVAYKDQSVLDGFRFGFVHLPDTMEILEFGRVDPWTLGRGQVLLTENFQKAWKEKWAEW